MSCHTSSNSAKRFAVNSFAAPRSAPSLIRSVASSLRDRPVYCYIVTTIETSPGLNLHQKGSAPNFDGGRITLCTCKHKDRATFFPSGKRSKPWEDVWVAGLTSISSKAPWTLAYLMLVEESLPDQYSLWTHLDPSCRAAKSASTSVIGDLYEPTPAASANPHSPINYRAPMTCHVHSPKRDPNYWYHDIEMWSSKKRSTGRPHQLLLGDLNYSYRWLTPRLRLRSKAMKPTAHHKMFATLRDFVANLI